ncbi:hypothetical protein BD779DRAFT_1477268 [Infundibulicybe gibba]|nr:hypothetical protein BD779DRAFT_1477268 [Infundibulicybe gibba]
MSAQRHPRVANSAIARLWRYTYLHHVLEADVRTPPWWMRLEWIMMEAQALGSRHTARCAPKAPENVHAGIIPASTVDVGVTQALGGCNVIGTFATSGTAQALVLRRCYIHTALVLASSRASTVLNINRPHPREGRVRFDNNPVKITVELMQQCLVSKELYPSEHLPSKLPEELTGSSTSSGPLLACSVPCGATKDIYSSWSTATSALRDILNTGLKYNQRRIQHVLLGLTDIDIPGKLYPRDLDVGVRRYASVWEGQGDRRQGMIQRQFSLNI